MIRAQVAQDLRAAAEVLRRDGWTQGEYSDATGCCAVGAIAEAVGGKPDPLGLTPAQAERWSEASATAGRLVRRDAKFPEDELVEWNDEPGRTADEVIAALEAAADVAERQAAYDEGRWCGECEYGVVNNPPCCTTGQVVPS